MKKLGFSSFGVEKGEEITLTISWVKTHLVGVAAIAACSLDGIELNPLAIGESSATYKFPVEKPIGQSHEFVVNLPHTNLENAEFKVELFGSGGPVHFQLVRPAGGQPFTNLIYTFSTHGTSGGSRR